MKKIVFVTIFALFFVIWAFGTVEVQHASAQTIPPGGTIPPGDPTIDLPNNIMQGQLITVIFGIPPGAWHVHLDTNGTIVSFPNDRCVPDTANRGINCTGARLLVVQIVTPARSERLWLQNRAYFFGTERIFKEIELYLLLLKNPSLDEFLTFTPIIKIRLE